MKKLGILCFALIVLVAFVSPVFAAETKDEVKKDAAVVEQNATVTDANATEVKKEVKKVKKVKKAKKAKKAEVKEEVKEEVKVDANNSADQK